jgi:hypothetical protein
MINWNEVKKDLSKIMNKVFIKSTIEYIKSLIAKEFKLVAGGKLTSEIIKIKNKDNTIDCSNALWIGKEFLNAKFIGLDDKNIEIYIREE